MKLCVNNRPSYLCSTANLILGFACILLTATGANAAEMIIFKSGIFRVSIPVGELENFAETGEVSPALADVLNRGNKNPEQVRLALKQEVPVDFLLLDRTLNNPLGEMMLDKMGEVVHPPQGGANRQALRAAIVLSASGDNQISLLEVIHNYPTNEVEVEGDRIIEASQQLRRFSDSFKEILQRLPGKIFNKRR